MTKNLFSSLRLSSGGGRRSAGLPPGFGSPELAGPQGPEGLPAPAPQGIPGEGGQGPHRARDQERDSRGTVEQRLDLERNCSGTVEQRLGKPICTSNPN